MIEICTVILVLVKVFDGINYSFKVPPTSFQWRQGLLTKIPKTVAVVTGGSKGLGIEMVKQLKDTYKVHKVFVLDKVQPQYDGLDYVECNIGDKREYEQRLKQVINICSVNGFHIGVFINNVGIRHSKSLLRMDDEEIMDLYNVNVLSYIWGARIILDNHLNNDNNCGNPLSIVTISSVLGMLAPRNLTIYSSTKAALSQLHEGLLQELIDYPNIRPLLVLPGQLLSGMFDDITPSREFFAPIIDHVKLAKLIIHKVNKGEVGTLCKPLYGNFLPLVKILPYSIIRLCRWFSEIDRKVKDN